MSVRNGIQCEVLVGPRTAGSTHVAEFVRILTLPPGRAPAFHEVSYELAGDPSRRGNDRGHFVSAQSTRPARAAFTIIELLVVIAVIGILTALLIPAVQAARASGRRAECANHLKQNTLAVIMYYDALGVLPPAYLTDSWPTQTTWFGVVDYSVNQVFPERGLIAPFIERDNAIYHCPSKVNDIFDLYNGETGGYGYNLNLGWVDYSNWPNVEQITRRLQDFPATSRTLVFSDAARIQLPWSGDPTLKATENFYLNGPDDDYAAPGTHFRHIGTVANVSFLDGHVEARTEMFVPSPSSWPPEANVLRDQLHIGYVSATSIETYRPR